MKKSIMMALLGLLVCCSALHAELVDNGDGTVTDTVTGLMWQQGEAGAMNWQNALIYCEDLALAGYDDWRLPNRNELQTLVDYAEFNPAIDIVRFPGAMSSYYCSSTTYAYNTGYAWLVYFGNGHVYSVHKSGSYYVRAVRAGQ